jgi:NAD(P)-dependent dehydrogenase (short-subunit alcohol dehydrogenase family)
MTLPLASRVAIVTGAAMGNGRGIALGLAAAGADIVIADLDTQTAEHVTGAEVRALGRRALALSTDVSSSASVDAMVAAALATFDRIDVLVNNAGVTGVFDLLELPEAEWDRVLDINLKGVFLCTQSVARAMVDAGRGGRIINISSTAGTRGVPYSAHYSASKGGVELFTRAAARALAPYRIHVNAVAPGVMETPLLQPFLDQPGQRERYTQAIPLGRIGQPSDLAGAAVYLASPASDFVTGTVLHVDGGSLA